MTAKKSCRFIKDVGSRYRQPWLRDIPMLPLEIDYSQNPTIITSEPSEGTNNLPILICAGVEYGFCIDDFFKNIDDSVKVTTLERGTKGGIIFDEGVYVIYFHYNQYTANKIPYIINNHLISKGIDSVTKNNDVFVNIDGKYKKTIGVGAINHNKNNFTAVVLITVKAPLSLLRKHLRLDNFKFQDKEPFSDISDIIGGLEEVGLDNSIVTEIVYEIGKEYNLEMVSDELTELEISKLVEYYVNNPY